MSGFFSSSEIQQERPVGLVPRCGACGLFKGCKTPKLPVQGQGQRGVLILGTAPEFEDDEEGAWASGEHGQFLRSRLYRLGVDLDEDAWYSSALICHTAATPTDKQVEHCRPNLLATLAKLRPRVVVPLGRPALCAVLSPYWKSDVGVLERWTGAVIPAPDFWILPTNHPAFLRYAKSEVLEREFIAQLKRAFAIKEAPEPRPEPKIRMIYEASDVARAVDYFCEQEWVAVDYETNCLKPEYEKAAIYSCALSDGKRTASFLWSKEAFAAMRRFYTSPAKKIASNLKFEERWTLRFFGHGVQNWGWDTMLAAHCLDNRPGICSLKFQSFVKLGVPTYNAHVEPYLSASKGHHNRVADCPLSDLLYYGGMDALLEHELAMLQMKEMSK